MKASFKKRWVSVKTGKSEIEVEILPGQFVYGRLSAAKKLKMKPSTVRNRMEKLKKMRNLDIKEDRQYSIVSIINWEAYQNIEETKGQRRGQPEDSQRTCKGQPKDTNKNVKEGGEGKEGIPPKPPKKKKELPTKTDIKELILENNFIESKDKIFEFFEYRMSMPASKRYKTKKGLNALFRDLNGCRDLGLIISDCLDEAMEREWQTPKPDYFKNKLTGNNGYDQNQTSSGDEWLEYRKAKAAKEARQ